MAELRVEDHGKHIAVITLVNEARRNAMTRAMMSELADLWDDLARSDHRCVVITGAGNKGFCAGADVSGDLTATPEVAETVNRSLLKTQMFPKPIIAAVNGDCVAGGVELMLACLPWASNDVWPCHTLHHIRWRKDACDRFSDPPAFERQLVPKEVRRSYMPM